MRIVLWLPPVLRLHVAPPDQPTPDCGSSHVISRKHFTASRLRPPGLLAEGSACALSLSTRSKKPRLETGCNRIGHRIRLRGCCRRCRTVTGQAQTDRTAHSTGSDERRDRNGQERQERQRLRKRGQRVAPTTRLRAPTFGHDFKARGNAR